MDGASAPACTQRAESVVRVAAQRKSKPPWVPVPGAFKELPFVRRAAKDAVGPFGFADVRRKGVEPVADDFRVVGGNVRGERKSGGVVVIGVHRENKLARVAFAFCEAGGGFGAAER